MESAKTSAMPTKPRISLRCIRATSLPFFHFSLRRNDETLATQFKSCRTILRSEFRRAQFNTIQFKARHSQHTAAADRIGLAVFNIEGWRLLATGGAFAHQRLQNAHWLPHQLRR